VVIEEKFDMWIAYRQQTQIDVPVNTFTWVLVRWTTNYTRVNFNILY